MGAGTVLGIADASMKVIDMPIVELPSVSAPGAQVFFNLTDAQLRNRQHPNHSLVIAEGPKVVHTALDAGLKPVSMLMRRKMIDTAGADLIRRAGDIPVYTADDDMLAALTGFRLQRAWVLCAFVRPQERSVSECLLGASRIAYLESLNEPSNVGAIFRAAAALNVDALILSPDCADPFHRRAVRVCMGSVFSLPWARCENKAVINELKENDFLTLGFALREPCVALGDESLLHREKVAVFLGTEDTGLTESTLDRMDQIVRIPMARGIDSLNVATAAAVAFWELRKAYQ